MVAFRPVSTSVIAMADFIGPPPGLSSRFARDAHQPALALEDEVVAGQVYRGHPARSP